MGIRRIMTFMLPWKESMMTMRTAASTFLQGNERKS